MPSVSQLTKRNLIEAKKNSTLKWLDVQTDDIQQKIFSLAVNSKASVKESYRQQKRRIEEEKQKAMKEAIQKQRDHDEKLKT